MFFLIAAAISLFVSPPLLSQHNQLDFPFIYRYSDDCKMGLNTHENQEILPTKYRSIHPTAIGNCWLLKTETKSQKKAFLLKDQQLIPLQYPDVKKINERWVCVGEKGRYGLVDTDGKGVALMQYMQLKPINTSMVLSYKRSGYGLIDDRGAVLLSNQYQNIIAWKGFGFWAKNNNRYQLYKETGQSHWIETFDSIKTSLLDRCAVQKNKKWGLINFKGTWIIEATYTDIQLFENSLMATLQQKKWTVLNFKGQEILKQVDSIQEIHPYLIVYQNNKAGLLDQEGNWIIPCENATISILNASTVSYSKENKLGYFDLKEQKKSKESYDAIKASAIDSLLLYQEDAKWGMIHKNGQVILPAEYSQISPSKYGFLEVRTADHLLGIFDHEGQEILPPVYKIIFDHKYYFKAKKEGSSWLYLNHKNQFLNCNQP